MRRAMNIRICDYCSDPHYPLNTIELSRKLNGEHISAELCDTCLEDINKYIKAKYET